MQRISLIVNLYTGRGRSFPSMLPGIEKCLATQYREIHIFYSVRKGDVTLLARKASHTSDVVVACGGDGTVNEALNGIMDTGVAFGILPFGTTNVFSHELGIGNDVHKACDVLLQKKVQNIDVGCANGRFFVLWCGVGIDAYVIQKVQPWLKKMLGPIAFDITILRKIFFLKPQRLRITLDDRQVFSGCFAVVTNTKLYGGRLVAPQAQLDDGLFNVLVIHKGHFMSLLRNYFGVSRKANPRFVDVGSFSARNIYVEAVTHALAQVDGEIMGPAPVDISIRKKALPLFVV